MGFFSLSNLHGVTRAAYLQGIGYMGVLTFPCSQSFEVGFSTLPKDVRLPVDSMGSKDHQHKGSIAIILGLGYAITS